MGKRQNKLILLKGILAACLLFNHLGGYATIVSAMLPDNSSAELELSSQDQHDNQENSLDNNQAMLDPSQESDLNDKTMNFEENDTEVGVEEETSGQDQEESTIEIDNNVDEQLEEENVVQPDADSNDASVEGTELIEDSIEEISLFAGERSIGTGLVQLWQVVPEGQTQEGKTTSEIMKALQCRPNHNLYPLNGSTQHETYVNSCYVDDALYLGEDTNYYHIYLSGYEGKVPKSQTHTFSLDLNGDGQYVDYKIQTVAYYVPASSTARSSVEEAQSNLNVPELNYYDQYLDKYNDSNAKSIELYSTATVQSPSYYANENGTLFHYLTSNVKVAGNYSKVTVGKAPSWMSSGVKYYSYDGVYFYTNWRNIRVDGTGAVNQSNPFYNYYQYLPIRSKSNYISNTFDTYTNANGGAGGKLVNTGKYFYAVQDKYGINGALQYAMGIHESGWGKSSLSINKNNLFGMNATDNNPYGNGTSFPSIEAGINYHADRYLSWGYTDPIDDYRYFGSHVGNKGSGMNVKYASDPFWGEKIAGWYYRFDSASGLKDYNYYAIGIKTSNAVVDVKSSANASSTTLYQTKNKKSNLTIKNYPVLITGESNGFYSIKTDTPIVNGKPQFNQQYKWSQTNGYITKNQILISNHTNYRSPSSWQESNTINHSLQATLDSMTGNVTLKGKAYIPYLEMKNTEDTDIYIVLKKPQGQDIYYKANRNKDGYGTIAGYDYSCSGFELTIPRSDLQQVGNYQLYIKVIDNITGEYMIKKLTNLSNPNTVVDKALGQQRITISAMNDIQFSIKNPFIDELVQTSETSFVGNQLVIKGKAYIPYYEASTASALTTTIIIKDPSGKDTAFNVSMNANGYGTVSGYNYTYSGFEVNIPISYFKKSGDYKVYIKMVDKTTGHTVIKYLVGAGNVGQVDHKIGIDSIITLYNQPNVTLKASTKKVDKVIQQSTIKIENQQLVIEGKAYIPNYEMINKNDVSAQIIIKNPSGQDRYYTVEQNTSGYGVIQDVNYNYSGYRVLIPSRDLSQIGNYQVFIKLVDKASGHTVIKSLSGLTNKGTITQQPLGDTLMTVTEQSGVKLAVANRKNDTIIQESSVKVENQQLVIEGKAYIPNYEMINKNDVSTQIVIKNPSGQDRYYTVEQNTSGYGVKGNFNYSYSGYRVSIPNSDLSQLGDYKVYIKMVDQTTGHTVIKTLSNLKNSTLKFSLMGNRQLVISNTSSVMFTIK